MKKPVDNELFTIGPCTYSPIEGSAVAATVMSFERTAFGLVVGQNVRLSCGTYSASGVVTRITVRDIDVESRFPGSMPCLLHFDHFGRYCDNDESEGPRTWYIVRENEGS